MVLLVKDQKRLFHHNQITTTPIFNYKTSISVTPVDLFIVIHNSVSLQVAIRRIESRICCFEVDSNEECVGNCSSYKIYQFDFEWD